MNGDRRISSICCVIAGYLMLATLYFGVVLWLPVAVGSSTKIAFAQQVEPKPTVDRLAMPELPENPTQVEAGRVSYYHNCMPCHGDEGQGLTAEFQPIQRLDRLWRISMLSWAPM